MAKQIKKKKKQISKKCKECLWWNQENKIEKSCHDIRDNTGEWPLHHLIYTVIWAQKTSNSKQISFRHGYSLSTAVFESFKNEWLVNRHLMKRLWKTFEWTLHNNTRKTYTINKMPLKESYHRQNGMTASGRRVCTWFIIITESPHRRRIRGDYNGINQRQNYLQLPKSKIGVLIAATSIWLERRTYVGHGVLWTITFIKIYQIY